jgi:hypothetical protein
MYVGWASIGYCESFWTWAYQSWDVRVERLDTYSSLRCRGVRVLGFEWFDEYILTSESERV